MRARAVVGLLAASLAVGTNGIAAAQTAPPPDETADDPAELRPAVDLQADRDLTSPAAVLPPLIDELVLVAAQRAPGRDSGRQARARQAATSATQALIEYTDGSSDIPAVIKELIHAARFLQVPGGPEDAVTRRLAAIASAFAGVAKTLASNMFDHAASAGVDRLRLESARTSIIRGDARLATGDAAGAAHLYGEGFGIASGGLHFDLDTFEAGIRVIGPLVVGYAYTITQGGSPVRADAEGDARTEADDPQTDHSPDKEQFLASVSKTITAVAMLRALQDKGISVESSIAPYLPLTWAQDPSMQNLRFRHLFTHRSGISGSQGNSHYKLRDRIAAPFPALPAGYEYSNANFGLMRVLLPRVAATASELVLLDLADGLDFGIFNTATIVYSTYFETYVGTRIFAPIGIDGRCRASDPVDTRQYNMPDGGVPGYVEPDRLRSCGGFGWFLSSNELAAFMVHLRYTNTLLSQPTRLLMDTLFLGWLDPVQFTWSTGDFGLYHNHGGDWFHTPGQAHTCAMKFPINVEVALVINSARNFVRHQCTILRDAFDAAWIA